MLVTRRYYIRGRPMLGIERRKRSSSNYCVLGPTWTDNLIALAQSESPGRSMGCVVRESDLPKFSVHLIALLEVFNSE